jgi:hypothetical protein
VPPAAITDLSGQDTQPAGNGKLWVRADSLPAGATVYFAVRSFDSTDNMSGLSNLYSVNIGASATRYLTWSAVPTAAYYHVRWSLKPMVENDSSMDTTNHYYFWAGNAIGNDINAPSFIGVENGGQVVASTSMDCYPNPFNPMVSIRVSLRNIAGVPVRISIVDARGRLIRAFDHAPVRAMRDYFNVQWDGTTGLGKEAASGIYYVLLKAGNYRMVRKIVFAK